MWPEKKYPNSTQPCPKKGEPGRLWGPVWTEQLDEFDRSGKWTETHKTQNDLLLLKIAQKFPKFVTLVMEKLARDHYRFRAHPDRERRLGTLCHLTIYAHTYSAYTLSRGFLFEFKMCPGRSPPAIGNVIRDSESWTQYNDEWRTYCFMVLPDHTDYKEVCTFVADNTKVDLFRQVFHHLSTAGPIRKNPLDNLPRGTGVPKQTLCCFNLRTMSFVVPQ